MPFSGFLYTSTFVHRSKIHIILTNTVYQWNVESYEIEPCIIFSVNILNVGSHPSLYFAGRHPGPFQCPIRSPVVWFRLEGERSVFRIALRRLDSMATELPAKYQPYINVCRGLEISRWNVLSATKMASVCRRYNLQLCVTGAVLELHNIIWINRLHTLTGFSAATQGQAASNYVELDGIRGNYYDGQLSRTLGQWSPFRCCYMCSIQITSSPLALDHLSHMVVSF